MYHRLFIQAQSLIFRTLGLGVLPARLASIVAGSLLLALVALHARRGLGFGVNLVLAVLAAILLNPIFFAAFKVARPEMLVALFGFASVIATEQASRAVRPVPWSMVAGLLAGCAMLAHLNGAIFVGAGFLMLLVRRRIPAAAIFALTAMLALTPYGIDIARHWDAFQVQFHGSMAGTLTKFSPATPLLNLLNEHKRLFRSLPIIFSSVLFFLCLGLGWRHAGPRIRFLAGYTVLLMVLLGALAVRKQTHYAVCLVALEMLVVVGIMQHLHTMGGWRRTVLPVSAAAFGISGAWYDVRDFSAREKFSQEALNRTVAASIPDGAWCLVPMPLLFNEVTRLNLVSTYAMSGLLGKEPDPALVRSFLGSRRIEYVVAMKDDPGEALLERMEPLALAAEGSTDGVPYRVYRVLYPPDAP